MSRPLKITILLVIGVAFLAASLGLARVLAASGAERTLLEGLIADQGAGRSAEVTALLPDCAPGSACATRTNAMIDRNSEAGGKVKILQIDGGAPLSAGSADGVARLAWKVGSGLPVVQCAVVRRQGSVTSGFEVDLLVLSKPIEAEGACPTVPELLAKPN
ncbi:MAG: hypothetical protein WCO96_06245 [Actinomycetes bacterium]